MGNKFQINGAIAIYKEDELFFSMAHLELLRLIQLEGSINAAAKRRGISYQQAWNLINQLNSIAPLPVVIRQKGGTGGGGCRISDYGLGLMRFYQKKLIKFGVCVESLNDEMESCFF